MQIGRKCKPLYTVSTKNSKGCVFKSERTRVLTISETAKPRGSSGGFCLECACFTGIAFSKHTHTHTGRTPQQDGLRLEVVVFSPPSVIQQDEGVEKWCVCWRLKSVCSFLGFFFFFGDVRIKSTVSKVRQGAVRGRRVLASCSMGNLRSLALTGPWLDSASEHSVLARWIQRHWSLLCVLSAQKMREREDYSYGKSWALGPGMGEYRYQFLFKVSKGQRGCRYQSLILHSKIIWHRARPPRQLVALLRQYERLVNYHLGQKERFLLP